jgi:CRISPR/Cas system Type II protein with McrA/HNH and RuvC-like nuclease domain
VRFYNTQLEFIWLHRSLANSIEEKNIRATKAYFEVKRRKTENDESINTTTTTTCISCCYKDYSNSAVASTSKYS